MLEDEQDDEAMAAEAELGALSAMSGDEPDFAELGKNPAGVLQKIYRQQRSAQDAAERGSAERFAAARERIAERNRGPSQSEILFALSRSMLSPKRYRGFAGFADNMVNTVSGIASSADKARREREDQLAALEESYAEKTSGYGVARAKTAADLVKTAAPLLRTGGGKTYDTNRGVFVDKTNPRPTENVYDVGGGRQLVQWQDGLWREELPAGGYRVFERAGTSFNEMPPEGAK